MISFDVFLSNHTSLIYRTTLKKNALKRKKKRINAGRYLPAFIVFVSNSVHGVYGVHGVHIPKA